jgi:hypothetical protein
MDFEREIIKIFQSTQNSYKYYWWYSILNLVKEKKKVLELDEIAIQMIVFSWYPVNYFKISLGKQDQISKHIIELKINFEELNDDIKEHDLLSFLKRNKQNTVVSEILKKLVRYVPYRFIRPWFNETISMKDGLVNNQIIVLQSSRNHLTPYFIDINKNEILSEPTKLWRNFIEIKGQSNNSVFENKPLLSIQKLAIDHYLPWSLVTHDKLWNLHPIEQEANSSKSNKIADDKYLWDYTNLQFKFIHHISSLNSKYLEDYFTLFSINKSELLNISNRKFTELLRTKIAIEIELATNLGYFTKWSYINHH